MVDKVQPLISGTVEVSPAAPLAALKRFQCIGCGKESERTGRYQKWCSALACQKKSMQLATQQYRKTHKKEIIASKKKYRKTYKKKIAVYDAKRYVKHCREHLDARARWQAANKERASVRSHHYNIFNPKSKSHRNYQGMPFFDGWNPDKRGSFKAAADWIIANLGKRPEGSTLHVIHHDLGFVPGNLEWTHPRRQSNQQMYKIIAQQRHRIHELEAQLVQLTQQSVAA